MESRNREKFFFDNKTEKIITILFAGLLLIQFGLWVYFNLFRQFVVDNDAAKLFYHTIKMWENKTFVIKDWMYPTTGEWDCSSILAALFYGLTGNIYISFGIANVVNIILMIVIVYQLMKQLKVRLPIIVFTLNVILIPYAWGMLEYSNMLFYGGAQYIYKVMIPLALCLMLVISDNTPGKLNWKFWIGAAFVSAGMFLTSSSSGLFCFACGILPILICRWVRAFLYKQIRIRSVIIWGVVIFIYFSGVLFQHICEIPLYAEELLLADGTTFGNNIIDNIVVYFKIMASFPNNELVSATSIEGIGYLLRFALCIFITISGLLFGLSGIKNINKLCRPDEKMVCSQHFLAGQLVFVFSINYILVILLNIKDALYHRSYLIGFVPLIILSGLWLNKQISQKERGAVLFCRILVGIVSVMIVYQWGCAFSEVQPCEADNYNQVIELKTQMDIKTVVFMRDSGSAEMCRLLDPSGQYVTYVVRDQGIVDHDDYGYNRENSNLSQRHLLVCQSESDFELLEEDLKGTYIRIVDLDGYIVYLSEHNYYDGVTGLYAGETSVDYPQSTGYYCSGSFDQDGVFVSSRYDHYAVVSPVFEAEKNEYQISMEYIAVGDSDELGTFDLYQGEELIQSSPITANSNAIALRIPAKTDGLYFRVQLHEGATIAIQRYVFAADMGESDI